MSCLTSCSGGGGDLEIQEGGGDLGRDIWHMTESRCIHSQELQLLVLLLVLLATGILNDLPGLTSCRCNNNI